MQIATTRPRSEDFDPRSRSFGAMIQPECSAVVAVAFSRNPSENRLFRVQ
jgi:hypothetical protein